MPPKKNYTPEQMAKAVTAVLTGGSSISSAAKNFGVPRITLHNKTSGKSPMVCRMGPSTVLTDFEEELLLKWIIALAERRFPITKDLLLDSVQRIVTEQRRSTPFLENRPGIKWYSSFLKRHPTIAERAAENINLARDAVTEDQIKNWFKEVKSYLNENGLSEILEDPERIFNTDESAFFLSPKPGKVLVKRGAKNVHLATGDAKENLTVLVTANAAGKLAPPMVVYAYDRIPANVARNVPETWAIGKSETGWMTGETFYEYITNVFHPWLIEKNIQRPVILFVDGHKSHLTIHLSRFCSENGIEIVALYPNSTHILQPMDIAVFRPLKLFYRKAVTQWKLENNGDKLKKENFAPVLEAALNKITEDCIKNGFRGGGLHPFGPDYIDYSKLKSQNEHNETIDRDEKQFFNKLETEIIKTFGRDKLSMYNTLYFEGRNVLENMSLEEDLNLYILWAHNKQKNAVDTVRDVRDPSSSRGAVDIDKDVPGPSSSGSAVDRDQDVPSPSLLGGAVHTNQEVPGLSTSRGAVDTDLDEPGPSSSADAVDRDQNLPGPSSSGDAEDSDRDVLGLSSSGVVLNTDRDVPGPSSSAGTVDRDQNEPGPSSSADAVDRYQNLPGPSSSGDAEDSDRDVLGLSSSGVVLNTDRDVPGPSSSAGTVDRDQNEPGPSSSADAVDRYQNLPGPSSSGDAEDSDRDVLGLSSSGVVLNTDRDVPGPSSSAGTVDRDQNEPGPSSLGSAVDTDRGLPGPSSSVSAVDKNQSLPGPSSSGGAVDINKDIPGPSSSRGAIAPFDDEGSSVTGFITSKITSKILIDSEVSRLASESLISQKNLSPSQTTPEKTVAASNTVVAVESPFLVTAEHSNIRPNISGCTPQKDSLNKYLGIEVPSPFKKCLFWPEKVKKKVHLRKKEKVPSAVTSPAWQKYYDYKEQEKIKKTQEKENRAEQRLKRKLEKQEKQTEKKKKSNKRKKVQYSGSSASEHTDTEIKYQESEDSEYDVQLDIDACESKSIREAKNKNLPGKKLKKQTEETDSESELPIAKLKTKAIVDNRKKVMRKGCFVIVTYEGEYFPGMIENTDKGRYEISTMTLSTGNNFKWPERPDKIWYPTSDVIEIISPPIPLNNRGFYKVKEMEKYLPDIYT